MILAKLPIDLSQYVSELAKPFGTQLHAKDDDTREAAKQCVASLASKCSDSDSILTLLKSIFDVLNGSEGKLSLADHKISLLSAIGKRYALKIIVPVHAKYWLKKEPVPDPEYTVGQKF